MGQSWSPSYPMLQVKLSHREKKDACLAHLLDRRDPPGEADGYPIIRPKHRFNLRRLETLQAAE